MQRGACGCTCGAGGEVPAEELDAPLLDLERRRGQDDYTVAPRMTAAAMAEAVRAALLDAQDVEMEKATWKAMKCVFRVRPNLRSYRCGADGISSIYLHILKSLFEICLVRRLLKENNCDKVE